MSNKTIYTKTKIVLNGITGIIETDNVKVLNTIKKELQQAKKGG
jgi:hypothetical protein